MEISTASTNNHEKKPYDMNPRVYKPSVVFEEMHQHGRYQQKYDIAKLLVKKYED